LFRLLKCIKARPKSRTTSQPSPCLQATADLEQIVQDYLSIVDRFARNDISKQHISHDRFFHLSFPSTTHSGRRAAFVAAPSNLPLIKVLRSKPGIDGISMMASMTAKYMYQPAGRQRKMRAPYRQAAYLLGQHYLGRVATRRRQPS